MRVSLEIEIENRKDLTEVEHGKVVELIQSLNPDEVDFDWLVDTTEKFCKDKAIYNAVVEGISIIDGKDKKRSPDAIPSILTDAPLQFHLIMLSGMIILMIVINGLSFIIR